jgi:hypothetical protein
MLDLKPREAQLSELPFPKRDVVAERDHVDVIVIARHGSIEESVLRDPPMMNTFGFRANSASSRGK